jgi:hypothetical protein
MHNGLRRVFGNRRRAGKVALLPYAVVMVSAFGLWLRSYWARDEFNIYLTHESAMLASSDGAIFFLAVKNYPVAGDWFYRTYHGAPDHPWNLADVWGPPAYWYRFPNSDYQEPLFELAGGTWKNFLTASKRTQMTYTAARVPYWTIVPLFALPLLLLLPGSRKGRISPDGAFPVR